MDMGARSVLPAREESGADAVVRGLARARQRAQSWASRLETAEARFGIVRLTLTLVALGTLVGVFSRLSLTMALVSVVLFVSGFLVLAAFHRVLRRRKELWLARATSFAAQEIRQLRDFSQLTAANVRDGSRLLAPWSLELVARPLPAGHTYAVDLDVGRLVFPLLDTCATPEASQQLYDLLLDEGLHADTMRVAAERRERVAAIRRYGRLLRDLDATRFFPDVLASWSQGKACRLSDLEQLMEAERTPRRTLLYCGFGILSVAAWAALLLPAHATFFASGATEAYVGSLLRYAIVPLMGLGVYKGLFDAAGALRRRMAGLDLLMRDVDALKAEPALAGLAHHVMESRRSLQWLRWALDLYGARSNPVFWLFVHVFLPFDALIGLLVWFMMRRIGSSFGLVVRGLIEFDCDAALARFASENPEFGFSHFSDAPGGLRLEACGMGHPLLPRHKRVSNSISWTSDDRIVILTGSNMSGKSTFLRTLGVNGLLHNIGAPVCAERFVAPPLRLLCAIRVDDALEAGTSYFYAEVKRLASLLQKLADRDRGAREASPLDVYLIDEIFRGTNNRERFLGSLYVLRGFMATHAIGLVTTHDLALTRLATIDDARHARNMHFRETISESGAEARLAFDYQLRSGPCPTTNALRIMHAEGLPVPAHVTAEDERALLAGDELGAPGLS